MTPAIARWLQIRNSVSDRLADQQAAILEAKGKERSADHRPRLVDQTNITTLQPPDTAS
jgi:hypothetical protein